MVKYLYGFFKQIEFGQCGTKPSALAEAFDIKDAFIFRGSFNQQECCVIKMNVEELSECEISAICNWTIKKLPVFMHTTIS